MKDLPGIEEYTGVGLDIPGAVSDSFDCLPETIFIEDDIVLKTADFVDSFNGMMFRNEDGSRCSICNEDIVLPKRSEWTIRNIQTSWN